MPSVWVYELEKRVRAGTLSREDAKGIFNTAVLGAQAQGFKPTGNSHVRGSQIDHRFSRQGGGRILCEEEGKGLGRHSREDTSSPAVASSLQSKTPGSMVTHFVRNKKNFSKRGLSQGKLPGELRGQAAVAGSKRANRPDDHLIDPEAEAALQRAIRNAPK